MNLFNSLCHQVDAVHKKIVNVEKQIKQQFIDKSNRNNGTTHSDDSAPNGETNTAAIEEDHLGDGMYNIANSFVGITKKIRK